MYLGTDSPGGAELPDLRLVLPALATWACTAVLLGGTARAACAAAAALAVVAVGVWALGRRERFPRLPLAAVAVCMAAGALATAGRLAAVESSPITHLANEEASVTLDLAITDDPRPRADPPAPGRPRLIIEARAEAVLADAAMPAADPANVPTPASAEGAAGTAGTAVFGTSDVSPAAEAGAVRTRVPVVVLASGEAWRDLLPSQRVRAEGTVLPAEGDPLVGGVFVVRGPPERLDPPSPAQAWAGHTRARLRAAASGLPEPADGLLPALVVGDTSRVPPETAAAFRDSGMTHLLTVSGSNLAIMTGAALGAMRWLGRTGVPAAVVGAATVAVFVLVARPEPSVLRAAFMASIALLAVALGRRRTGVAALAAATLGLLLFDPGLARSFGFALSVLATAGILVLAPRWRDRWSARLPTWLAEAVAVALAAHVACLPLLAVLSAEVSWVAVPANVLAAPAVPLASVGGFAVAGLALVWPWAAQTVVWLPGAAVLWIDAVASTAARLPGRAVPWPATALGAVLLALLVAAALALRGRTARAVGAAGLAAALTALALTWVAPGWPPPGWALVACRIGQGDALVLTAEGGGRAVVVDTGPDPAAIDSCLADLRVSEVALLVLTHGDLDHVGGTRGAIGGRSVRAALVPPAFDHPQTLRTLRSERIPVHVGTAGQRWRVAPWTLDVLWPRAGGAAPVGNDGSVVLLARWPLASGGAMTALLTGDIEEPAQRALLGSHAVRGVDVLKVPHHGAGSQEPTFIAATRPDITLTSVGAGNPYGHPDPATWAQLRRLPSADYRTDRHGDIAVVPEPRGAGGRPAERPAAVCRDPGPRRGAGRTAARTARRRAQRTARRLSGARHRTVAGAWHAAGMASTSAPPPLSVVVGDEELLVDRAVAELVAAARAEEPGVDVHDLMPGQVTAGKLVEVTSPSLFGERRVVVLRAVQDLGKDLAAEVTRYLTAPAEDVMLVLVHAGGAKGKALLDAAVKAGATRITCAKPTKASERLQFVKGEFARAGRQITADAAQALLDAVGTDLRELAAACTQLAADTEGRVDAAAVARYHTGKAEVSGFTVADRAVEGRIPEALEQLRWCLAVGTAPVLINSALAGAVRGLAVVAQPQRGVPDTELAKAAKVPPWKLKTLRQQARGWSPTGVARALAVVAETDALIKGAGRDPAYALERAVIEIAGARNQR